MNAQDLRVFQEFSHIAAHRHGRHCKRFSNHKEFIKVGSGFYSEVYRHLLVPGVVLKISGPEGFGYGYASSVQNSFQSKRDFPRPDIWPEFAKICMQYPNKNLPTILHMWEITYGVTAAVMPEYSPARYSECFRGVAERVLSGASEPALSDQDWVYACRDLLRNEPYADVDVHSDNVMLDTESNELILIDPFSSTGAT